MAVARRGPARCGAIDRIDHWMRTRRGRVPGEADGRFRSGGGDWRVDETGEDSGDDAIAALAGEAEDLRPSPSPCRAPALRAAARAHGRVGCGPSPAGIERHAAVSSTVMSSTSRMTNTVRKATGSSSIRRSRMRRTSARSAAVVGDSDFSSATSITAGSRSVRAIAAERDDDTVALLPPQPHQRLVDHDAGEPGGELRFAAEVVDAAIGRRGTRPAPRPRPRRHP